MQGSKPDPEIMSETTNNTIHTSLFIMISVLFLTCQKYIVYFLQIFSTAKVFFLLFMSVFVQYENNRPLLLCRYLGNFQV